MSIRVDRPRILITPELLQQKREVAAAKPYETGWTTLQNEAIRDLNPATYGGVALAWNLSLAYLINGSNVYAYRAIALCQAEVATMPMTVSPRPVWARAVP